MKFLLISIISALSLSATANFAFADHPDEPTCKDYSGVWVGHCSGPAGNSRSAYLLKQVGCENLEFYNNRGELQRTVELGESFKSRFRGANNYFYNLTDRIKWSRNQSRLSYTRYGTMDDGFEFYDVEALGDLIISRDGERLTEYSDWEYVNRFGRRYFERYRCDYNYRGEVESDTDYSTLPKNTSNTL